MTLHRETRLPAVAPALTLDGRVLLPATAVSVVVTDLADLALINDLCERPASLRFLVTTTPRPTIALAAAIERENEVGVEYGVIALLTDVSAVPGGLECRFEGRSVCRVESLPAGLGPTAPYRQVRVRHLVDRPDPLALARRETTDVIQAFLGLCTTFGLAAGDIRAATDIPVDLNGLVYRIASSVAADYSALRPMLAERCPSQRRQMVLKMIVRQLAFAQRERLLARHVDYTC
jgi:hypothetical protein